MSFRLCVVPRRPLLLSQADSKVVPLRDFNKAVHRVAVTGDLDEQTRLFWVDCVFHFSVSENCCSRIYMSGAKCLVLYLLFILYPSKVHALVHA